MDKIAKLINENLRNIIAEIENLLAQKIMIGKRYIN
jgi:hypothetical protein